MDDLREDLLRAAPTVFGELNALARVWLEPVHERLAAGERALPTYPKTFNDPVWETIELNPWEVLLLDAPLLQRLRGVRQLGLAQYVYPSACHDRFQHSLGVCEAADRMIRALTRNAQHRRTYSEDDAVPEPSTLDVTAIRLAGLLHDTGHGPFSHTTEPFLRARYERDFANLTDALRAHFPGTTKVAPGEAIAVLLVLSDPLREVFHHPRFAPRLDVDGAALGPAIAARLLGSRAFLDASYLSGLISGPLDADKLDYMARDSLHAGLPLGLDIRRIITKLEVVTVTPETAPNPELRQRALDQGGRLYELGLSTAAVGSYDQLTIGRVNLYDRLYYHPKVRATEAMVRRLVLLAEEERGRAFRLPEFFAGVSDETMIGLLGGELRSDAVVGGGPRSRALAKAIRNRPLYERSFAFAARFIGGLDALPADARRDARAELWGRVLDTLADDDGREALGARIVDMARALGARVPELGPAAQGLLPEHVLVDVPPSKAVARSGDLLTRASSGRIGAPNAFFDAERWSQAYEQRRQCGYVFAPRARRPLIALASRLVFYEAFGMAQAADADDAAKTFDLVPPAWIHAAHQVGLCPPDAVQALLRRRLEFEDLCARPLDAPADQVEAWVRDLHDALPFGLPAGVAEPARRCLEDLARAAAGAPAAWLDDLPAEGAERWGGIWTERLAPDASPTPLADRHHVCRVVRCLVRTGADARRVEVAARLEDGLDQAALTLHLPG